MDLLAALPKGVSVDKNWTDDNKSLTVTYQSLLSKMTGSVPPQNNTISSTNDGLKTPAQSVDYVVKPGDSLSKIANKYYPDMSNKKAQDIIFENNKEKLSSGRNKINVGMILSLPNISKPKIDEVLVAKTQPEIKNETKNNTNSPSNFMYLSKPEDSLNSIIGKHYPINKDANETITNEAQKANQTEIKQKIILANVGVDFSRKIENNTFINLPNVSVAVRDERIVEVKDASYSLHMARNILMPTIKKMLSVDMVAINAGAAVTNFTSLDSISKFGVGVVGYETGHSLLLKQPNEDGYVPNFTRSLMNEAFGNDEAQKYTLSFSSPGLGKKVDFGNNGSYLALKTMAEVETSLEIPRSALNSHGEQIRIATFIIDLAVPIKNNNKINSSKISVGNNNLNINSGTLTYRIATEKQRLKNIVLSVESLPDPFTLSNFKPGDAITLDISKTKKSENDISIVKKIKNSGVGVGSTGLASELVSSGERIMLQMSEAKDGSRRVTIFVGSSSSNTKVRAAGAIVNVDVSKNNVLGDALSIKTGHLRATAQEEKISRTHSFNFVEVNIDTPEGRKIYFSALKTGKIPSAGLNKKIDGVKAHGMLTFTQVKNANKIELNQFITKNWSKVVNYIAGEDTSAKQQWEPVTRYSVFRQLKVNHSANDSILQEEGAINTNHDGEHRFNDLFFAFGLGNKFLERNDDNAFVLNVNTDGSTGERDITSLLSSLDVNEYEIVNLLEENVRKRENNESIPYKPIALHTKDEILYGREAITYLNRNKPIVKNILDSFDGTFFPDKVGVNIETNNTKNTKDFLYGISSGIKTFVESNNSNSQANKFIAPYYDSIDKAEKWLNDVGLNYIDPDNPLFAKQLSESKSLAEIGKTLSNVDVGQLLNMIGKLDGTFPIEINIHVGNQR